MGSIRINIIKVVILVNSSSFVLFKFDYCQLSFVCLSVDLSVIVCLSTCFCLSVLSGYLYVSFCLSVLISVSRLSVYLSLSACQLMSLYLSIFVREHMFNCL